MARRSSRRVGDAHLIPGSSPGVERFMRAGGHWIFPIAAIGALGYVAWRYFNHQRLAPAPQAQPPPIAPPGPNPLPPAPPAPPAAEQFSGPAYSFTPAAAGWYYRPG